MKMLKYAMMVLITFGTMQVMAQDGSTRKVKRGKKTAVRNVTPEKTAPVAPQEIDKEKKAPKANEKTDVKRNDVQPARMKTSKKPIRKTATPGK